MKEIGEKDLEKAAGGAAAIKEIGGKSAEEEITGNKCGKYDPATEALKYMPPVLLKCSNCAHYRQDPGKPFYCELGMTVKGG